ncbi:MAG: C2H2-type zinc finger protein [Candidatus Bathyarchaeia archaeon]
MNEKAGDKAGYPRRSRRPHPFKPICVRCGREFSSDSSLLNHFRRSHPDLYAMEAIRRGLIPEAVTVFKCHICGRRFMTMEGYGKHVASKHPSPASNGGGLS